MTNVNDENAENGKSGSVALALVCLKCGSELFTRTQIVKLAAVRGKISISPLEPAPTYTCTICGEEKEKDLFD